MRVGMLSAPVLGNPNCIDVSLTDSISPGLEAYVVRVTCLISMLTCVLAGSPGGKVTQTLSAEVGIQNSPLVERIDFGSGWPLPIARD